MRKFKRLTSVLAVVLMLMLVLTACGGKTEPQTSGNGEEKKLDYPKKPITLVVPFAAGAGSDITGRIIADIASKYSDQPIVVENVVGGGGVVGTTDVWKATPDGYRILYAAAGTVTVQPILGTAKYDWGDLDPICGVSDNAYYMSVPKNSPINNVKELIEWSKANPGKFRYGCAGLNIPGDLIAKLIAYKAGVKFQTVAFDSGAEGIAAALGGHVEAATGIETEMPSYVESGDMKMVYVSTKSTLFPDVQTLKESGIIEEDLNGITGIYAPPGTPPEIIEYLAEVFKKALADPAIQPYVEKGTMTVNYYTADEMVKKLDFFHNSFKEALTAMGAVPSK